jgi:type II secretory pathway pseudopilin PulG
MTARHDGFTLVELLISTAVMMVVMGVTFALINPAHGMFAAQPEAVDMQQRLRVCIDALTRDLRNAGAGTNRFAASVLPYRVGAANADSPGRYFADRITVMYVSPNSAQTRTADPVASLSPALSVAIDPGCPVGDLVCGFSKDMSLIVMDDAGAWDTFTVTDIQGSVLQLQHRGAQLSQTYPAGAFISQVVAFTYWLKTDAPAQTYQLMRYDGNQSDVPIADNVVGLTFEYFGEPPPGSGTAGLVKLTEGELTDGPWRPDAVSAGRYDADLLRVRMVRVTLRVQTANSTFRGPAGLWFVHGGASRGGERYLPDQEVTFDVAPRNFTADR